MTWPMPWQWLFVTPSVRDVEEMLDYLKGKVVETGEEDWVVEANGFGFRLESHSFRFSRGYWRRKMSSFARFYEGERRIHPLWI